MQALLSKWSYSTKIDLANIGLMLLSCLLAMKLPFALFLFSYAIMGPLHYLTEIFWLRKNQYHLPGKNDYLWLVAIAVIILLMPVVYRLFLKGISFHVSYFTNSLVLFAFFSAIMLTLIKDKVSRLLALLFFATLSLLLWKWPTSVLLTGILLNTVIHVCLFTWIFMFLGAIKNNNATGYTSLVFYVLSILFLLFVPVNIRAFAFSSYEKNSFLTSGFSYLNKILAKGFAGSDGVSIFENEGNIRIQSVLAFVYTYHYLNWFSKVEIIKWHKVKMSIKLITCIIWLAAIALYAYDYRTGLTALFFLSLLHVILEFPLNVKSMELMWLAAKRKWSVVKN